MNETIQTCPNCGALRPETSKDRARFDRRHPKKCARHDRFQRDLAAETRSVDADEFDSGSIKEIEDDLIELFTKYRVRS